MTNERLTQSPFADLSKKIAALNAGGAVVAAVAAETNPPAVDDTNTALAVRPKVAGSHRFYTRGVLFSLACFFANDTTKAEIEAASAYVDSRVVKNEAGEPEAFVVAFQIEKGRDVKKDLIRGTFLSGMPKGFNPETDLLLPLKTIGVEYVSGKDANEIRSSKGAISGRVLAPRKNSNIWRFWPDGFAPAREIEIFNQLLTQMGQTSQCVKPIPSDLYSPGARLRRYTAKRLTARPGNDGFEMGDSDGKIDVLTQRSQRPPIGQEYEFWYKEYEGWTIHKLAGAVGAIDPSTRPTVLEMQYSLDYEAALGLAKEYLSPALIDTVVDRLLDTPMDMDHPTYAYLVGTLKLFKEEEEYDYKAKQVENALELARKLAKEEIELFFRTVETEFGGLQIPKLQEILGDGVSVEDFQGASAGEDPLTRLIAAALQEEFDYDRPLHMHIRQFLLAKAVSEDKLTKQENAEEAPQKAELPKVMVKPSILGVRTNFDAVALLGIREMTIDAAEARVKALTGAEGDLTQIVGAFATMGVVLDLQDKKHLDRLIEVLEMCGKKIGDYIKGQAKPT